MQGEVAAGEAVDLQLRICVTGGRGGTADLLASVQVGAFANATWQCLLWVNSNDTIDTMGVHTYISSFASAGLHASA